MTNPIDQQILIQQPKHPQDVETSEEKKIRYRSIRIAQLAMFIFATGFSVILTGVYPYMKEVRFDFSRPVSRYLLLKFVLTGCLNNKTGISWSHISDPCA